ncbi:MAG: nucleotide sugar dehydrogenase [Deltaproteobacteria bacterium]|nr:nucleotide sugar dehydrogenase [Deltaproteobacteria bacterium]
MSPSYLIARGSFPPPPPQTSVAIVGLGRVGLPLALAFASRGLRVTGVERDAKTRAAIAEGRMPFQEPGCEELLRAHPIELMADVSELSGDRAPDFVVITVGTPLQAHIEVDLTQLAAVAQGLSRVLRRGQTIVLRSTVAARTTEYVARLLSRETGLLPGQDFHLAFCPERMVEGGALRELDTLPQVIGADDEASRAKASTLFSAFPVDQLHTSLVGGELIKLFNNVTRYVSFALANQFALIADQFGESVHPLIAMANHGYPRDPIARPGFAAGACLRKDFGMVSENHSTTDMLVAAWRVNEYMPNFVARKLAEQAGGLHQKRVAVLGYTFKRDSDDARDSLTPKLLRYIEREVPAEVRIAEPNLEGPIALEQGGSARNWAPRDALEGADAVVIAMNHGAFADVRKLLLGPGSIVASGAWVADLWNVCDTGALFFCARPRVEAGP